MQCLSLFQRYIALFIFLIPVTSFPLTYNALYIIGDSLSDQGNLFGATATLVGPANALPGSDHYFNGRFSNGPNYIDLVAQALGVTSGTSLTGGNNFAYGGARTTYNTVETTVGGPLPPGLFPWSLNAEVAAFITRGVHHPHALYIIFSGSNDIADTVRLGLPASVVIANTVNSILAGVQAFESAGHRHRRSKSSGSGAHPRLFRQ